MPNMETQWATEFNVHKLKYLSQMIIKSTLCFILCGRNVNDYHLVFSTFVFPKISINRKSVGDRGGLEGWRTSGTVVKVSWTPSLRKWFLTGNPQRALRSIQNAHKVSTSYRMTWRHYLPFSLILSWVYSFPEAMWYAVSQKNTSEKANIRLQPPSSKPDMKQICKNGKLSLSSH